MLTQHWCLFIERKHYAFLRDGKIIIKLNDEFSMGISKLTLKGKHNIKNTMAATLASQLLNVRVILSR